MFDWTHHFQVHEGAAYHGHTWENHSPHGQDTKEKEVQPGGTGL